MEKVRYLVITSILALYFSGCSNDSETENLSENPRKFSMGFTTWSFGPNQQDVDDTYDFISDNADVYVEHLDTNIPWKALINDLPLPSEFTNEVAGRANRKIPNKDLVLSIGLLNLTRNNLAPDFDGSVPTYTHLNDVHIEDAYTKHVEYLLTQFAPDYVTIAIEVNELWLQNNALWQGYTLLIDKVIERTKTSFPDIKISVSISVHNLFEAEVENPETYMNSVFTHINQMDFIAISYYPFLKNQSTVDEFQTTFDFLHNNTTKPIAFVESGHLAEDLNVPNLGVSIDGNATEQNIFLETLLANAQNQNYEMVNIWCHRDYDALWEVFPTELKDLGQLWRDTGLLDEDGVPRTAFNTWQSYFEQ